eukprot:m51a1_g3293 putative 40S ribosomal protein S7e (223) ;mRNA; r:281725-282772
MTQRVTPSSPEMLTASSKLVKKVKKVTTTRVVKGKRFVNTKLVQIPSSDLEKQVAQAIYDLEVNASADFKEDLKDLRIGAAKEIEIDAARKAIVVFVPYRLLKAFHKVQARLVRELEKKFSGRHVVIIGQRKMLPARADRGSMRCPRSHTLTAVHDAIMADVCYPTEVTGRRLRLRADGQRLHVIYLDSKDQQNVEPKLKTFTTVYRKLTGKQCSFEFPVVA